MSAVAGRRLQALLTVALVLTFGVVVLGAWVRLSDAGLACPDWPGCYGRLLVPDPAVAAQHRAHEIRPLETGKAWKEMTHRYAAGLLGLLILVIAILAWRQGRVLRRLAVLCAILVLVQALLGLWTVTLLLTPLIVVLHLLGGMGLLALLLWMRLSAPGLLGADGGAGMDAGADVEAGAAGMDAGADVEAGAGRKAGVDAEGEAGAGASAGLGAGMGTGTSRLVPWACAGLLMLFVQIGLGGWTSANYAGLACPDFPTCQGQWWPDGVDFRQGFTPWRGVGIDQSDSLPPGGRTAIAVAHRIGALVTLLLLAGIACVALRQPVSRLRWLAGIMLLLLIVQWALGIAIVLLRAPLLIANAHNAAAALLLLSLVALLHTAGRW